MQIEVQKARRIKLSDFADQHGLKMKVVERTRTDLHSSIPFEPSRWFAYFDDVEVKDGSVLIGTHGNGPTQAQAIKAYAREISGKCLVVDAFNRETRREIYAPELV
jgi:hypothetical protein